MYFIPFALISYTGIYYSLRRPDLLVLTVNFLSWSMAAALEWSLRSFCRGFCDFCPFRGAKKCVEERRSVTPPSTDVSHLRYSTFRPTFLSQFAAHRSGGRLGSWICCRGIVRLGRSKEVWCWLQNSVVPVWTVPGQSIYLWQI